MPFASKVLVGKPGAERSQLAYLQSLERKTSRSLVYEATLLIVVGCLAGNWAGGPGLALQPNESWQLQIGQDR